MNAYDFDNTIFYGDSTARFYLFSLKRHPKIIANTPSLLHAFVRFYVRKRGDKTEFKQTMYRFLTYIPDIDSEVEAFWKKHKCDIKAFYIKQKRSDDVIISASPEFLLSPVCRSLGIKSLIASKVDKHSGKYTGKNCHGEEKVRRFHEVFGKTEICEFYSDSHSDDPMARIANKAYMVKKETITPGVFDD